MEKSNAKVESCQVCGKKFNLLKMVISHNCKRCSRKVCAECGKNRRRIITYKVDPVKPHKVCLVCKQEMDFLFHFQKTNGLKYATMSNVGRYWCRSAGIEEFQEKSGSREYRDYLEAFDPNGALFKEDHIQIEKDLEGRSDRQVFNRSFEEALETLQEGMEITDVRKHVRNVVRAMCAKLPKLGYTQGMNYVVTFLLCFTDEEHAFWLLLHIIENVVGLQFYEKSERGKALSGYMMEIFIIERLFQNKFKQSPEELQAISYYMNLYGAQILIPFFVNFLPFEPVCQIWHHLFAYNSILEMERIMIAVMRTIVEIVADHDPLQMNSGQLLTLIQMHVKWSDIASRMSDIEITEQERNELRHEYLLKQSNEWNKADPLALYRLSKFTHFNKAEISELQAQFSRIVNIKTEENQGKIGLTCDEFTNIIAALMSNPDIGGRLKYLNHCNLKSLYALLDDDKTEKLDFRELLYALSLLSRGTVEEKMALLFSLFENDKILSGLDFPNFLDALCEMISASGSDDLVASEEDLAYFRLRIIGLLGTQHEIHFSDLQKVRSDPLFAKFVTGEVKEVKRRNTSLNLANTIKLEAQRIEERKSQGNFKCKDEMVRRESESSSDESSLINTNHNSPPLNVPELDLADTVNEPRYFEVVENIVNWNSQPEVFEIAPDHQKSHLIEAQPNEQELKAGHLPIKESNDVEGNKNSEEIHPMLEPPAREEKLHEPTDGNLNVPQEGGGKVSSNRGSHNTSNDAKGDSENFTVRSTQVDSLAYPRDRRITESPELRPKGDSPAKQESMTPGGNEERPSENRFRISKEMKLDCPEEEIFRHHYRTKESALKGTKQNQCEVCSIM